MGIRDTAARRRAKELGHTYYFTGKKCSRGHIADRLTSSGSCVECDRLRHERQEIHQKRREYYAENREKVLRSRWLKSGIPEDEIDKALSNKTQSCQICQSPDAILVLDHCHDTGRFRGWLCHKCNLGIGYLNDDPILAEMAFRYLNHFEQQAIAVRRKGS